MTDYKEQVAEVIGNIDFSKTKYQVVFDTSMGTMRFDLYPEVAPNHAKNIIALTKIGFYNDLIFHRVVKGFVIQVGCPNGTGTGGPGYNVDAEFNEYPHKPGVLSMARAQDPNSAGSQFFVCLDEVSYLNNQYTVFGKTADEESLEVVKKVGECKTDSRDKPLEDIKIKSTEVVETSL